MFLHDLHPKPVLRDPLFARLVSLRLANRFHNRGQLQIRLLHSLHPGNQAQRAERQQLGIVGIGLERDRLKHTHHPIGPIAAINAQRIPRLGVVRRSNLFAHQRPHPCLLKAGTHGRVQRRPAAAPLGSCARRGIDIPAHQVFQAGQKALRQVSLALAYLYPIGKRLLQQAPDRLWVGGWFGSVTAAPPRSPGLPTSPCLRRDQGTVPGPSPG